MTTLIVVVVLLLAGGLIYLSTLDGKYHVKRSLDVGVDPATVLAKVADFRSWPDWSPWLLHEPEATLVYSDQPDQVDGWYSWDGQHVGAGKLIHVAFEGEEKITQRIEFIRPFKSVSTIEWEFETVDNGTRVSWSMKGEMPFLFRFMAKKMPDFIGKDYDFGLLLLRAQFDAEAEVPRMRFDGEVELPKQDYLAIPFSGHLTEMQTAMEEGFPRLMNYIAEHEITLSDSPRSIYHDVNLKTMHFVCDMAAPVSEGVMSDEFEVKTFSGGRFYKVTVQGSYEFLELAWYKAYSHMQMCKIKTDSKRPSVEAYENDPTAVTHSNEIQTTLYLPLK